MAKENLVVTVSPKKALSGQSKILIVGAGLSGAVIARQLVEAGFRVHVVDSRPYVAGNCYTEIDTQTGVMVHVHGPHIFHTDNERVWDYVRGFGEFVPYRLGVKATTKGRVFSLPINLLTINQFFGKTFNPQEAKAFIELQADSSHVDPRTFEEQALRFLGRDLYEAFFKGYPSKQWGMHPNKLPASVLKRLPVRFNYDDNYFAHKFQGIPREGYTKIVDRILDHPMIEVSLGTTFTREQAETYDHTFYSGKIDGWFDFRLGHLGYRTLRFEASRHNGDYQGCAVMSYPDEEVPYTRITEHKHFAPWESHDQTIVFKEFSSLADPDDIPYYPIRLADERAMLKDYIDLAEQEKRVTFVGRLGTYRYLDMDVTIAEALATSEQFIAAVLAGQSIRPFYVAPL